MTQGFDKWFKEKFKDLHEAICCGDLLANNYKKAIKKSFNAGAASRQAEVDALNALSEMSEQKIDDLVLRNIELQKRVDEIENHVGINYDCEREDDNHSYWSGYNQAMREMNIILHGEGESNE